MSGDVNKSSNGADCFVMIANTVLINGTSNIYQQSPARGGMQAGGPERANRYDPEQKSVAVLKRGAPDGTSEQNDHRCFRKSNGKGMRAEDG